MKVAQFLQSRSENWRELERLCSELQGRKGYRAPGRAVTRFAALYRGACADLAMADAYHLPSGTVNYLHQLVGRAHNQLYRSRRFQFRTWSHEMLVVVPGRLFHDNSLRLAFVIFWGFFLASMYLASAASPASGYAEQVLGEEFMVMLEEMYTDPIGANPNASGSEGIMTGFYINHNTGIGLRCFAAGLLFGVGGLFATTFNAFYLGAAFGFMTRVPQGHNFFHFVTAHAPFELTAIVLSAAAGMRLGFSLVDTRGLTRLGSLRREVDRSMPIMGAAMGLFFLAALIEGFLSRAALPYFVKAVVAVLSCGMLLVYFVVLGYTRRSPDAAG